MRCLYIFFFGALRHVLVLLLVAGFNLLERPDNPTRTDFAVVKVVLDELKEHVKEGHCDKFLTVAEKSKFLKLATPPVSRIRTSNYGSVKLELKVFARYAGITLFVLDPFKPTVQGKNNEGHPIGVFDVNPHITCIVGTRDAQMKCVPPPSSPPPSIPSSLSVLSTLLSIPLSPFELYLCAAQATQYESLHYKVGESP